MKHLKSILALSSFVALSQFSFAQTTELSSELNLTGFSGGACNINVIPNSNASNLNLDEPVSSLDVATVVTQCDYDYRIVVDGETTLGEFSLNHSEDNQTYVPYLAFVDGIPFFGAFAGSDLGTYTAGDNQTLPVEIETLGLATLPGIYQGSLTFSVVVD